MQTSCWLHAICVGSLITGCLCCSGHSDYAIDSLISANNTFGLSVFHWLVERDGGKNIFISPTSLAMALSMTYSGASGETKEAMAEALELQDMSLEEMNQANAALMEKLKSLGKDIRLDMANSLWARDGEEFKSDFLKRNDEFYGADLRYLDFNDPEAPSVINTWVEEKTQGRIEELVDEIPEGVILYLINAVYFKGIWTVKFDEEYTRERDFTLLDGSKKKVPMMMNTSKEFEYLMGESFDAVGLPYGDGKVSMYIFVPHRESSLEDLYGELSAGNWDDWMSQFQQSEVMVFMPRFELEYDVVLNDALAALGMRVAFDAGRADFSRMCSGKVWIDEVKHKTHLEVNEEGTEAAAATSVSMKKGAAMPIYVDRPFFCAIRDNDTRAILFMGSIVEP